MNRKRFGDCLNALSSLGILLANSAMTVLVVLFGASFCKYSYLFSLTLSIYGAVFFYVLFVILDQRWNPLVPLQDFQRREMFGVLHRQGALTGVAWSVNYVLVTAANPFVPGLLLLVLHSSGMAFLVFLSVLLLENSYCLAQWGCIALVCAGRSLAMLDESVDDRRGIWALVYGLGVWAVGVANLLTENVMRNVRRVCEGDEETRQPLISVVQFLCVVKLYSIPATLALCWIPRAARGPARARPRPSRTRQTQALVLTHWSALQCGGASWASTTGSRRGSRSSPMSSPWGAEWSTRPSRCCRRRGHHARLASAGPSGSSRSARPSTRAWIQQHSPRAWN
uniref:Uncharacterized protein n=1 Tax=Alexandrium monilatum TaxID=311494 RepID=A0A7S4UD30_9DINO